MKPASALLPGLRYGFVALAVALGLALVASASASEPAGATGNTPGRNSNPGDLQSTTTLTCTLNFADVPPTDEFYPYVMCLACQGIIGGYPCGGVGEPCNADSDPYFRPGQPVTRGQIAKILSISAGFNEPVAPTQETFADVAYGSAFWEYVERLASRGVMDGFACGGDSEPCDWLNRPYFRPSDNTNRGQLMKAVNKAIHTGGEGGKDGSSNGVRGGDGPLDGLITRAETAEAVSKAFFPDCAP